MFSLYSLVWKLLIKMMKQNKNGIKIENILKFTENAVNKENKIRFLSLFFLRYFKKK